MEDTNRHNVLAIQTSQISGNVGGIEILSPREDVERDKKISKQVSKNKMSFSGLGVEM